MAVISLGRFGGILKQSGQYMAVFIGLKLTDLAFIEI
jgi:hypothetical protein